MRLPHTCKTVKYKETGTATLTRERTRVFGMKDGSCVMDTTFKTVREAKHFMGSTRTL